MLGVKSSNNCYLLSHPQNALLVGKDELGEWHEKLGHMSVEMMIKLSNKNLVKGMPVFDNKARLSCGACATGKQTRAVHPVTGQKSSSRIQEMIQKDLMGPTEVASIAGKRYIMVCVDDFSRYTWTEFLKEKSDAFQAFERLCKQLMVQKDLKIKRIRSDHGREFENSQFEDFCNQHGIIHEFSAPHTPQQNGVAERKNMTLQEMARTMMKAKDVSSRF